MNDLKEIHRERGNGQKHYNVGEKHGRAKLRETDIVLIRADAANGVSQARLARQHNVTEACISRIVNRVDWAHVE